MHAFGQPADMQPLVKYAKAHALAVIEDSCEAIGAEYQGRNAGTLGDAGVFAFYPNKQMTTGEGGMICTDLDGWDALCRSLRNQGRAVGDAWLNHTHLGYNYRLDEMSAALGLAQLQRLDALLRKREQVAAWYHTYLSQHELIETPYVAPTTTRMSWFVYVVRLRSPRAAFRPAHTSRPFICSRFTWSALDTGGATSRSPRRWGLPVWRCRSPA